MRKFVLTVVAMVTLSVPAQAHRADVVVNGTRVGPIKLGETNLRQVKRWFGEPTSYKVVRVGCIHLPRVRWGRRLTMIIGRPSVGRTDVEAEVRNPVIESSKHGPISVHTRKGLAIGDTEVELLTLYPNAEGEFHDGHTHYLLKFTQEGKLIADVEGGIVLSLLTGPYEFC